MYLIGMTREDYMKKKLHAAIILLALIPVGVFLPACSKNTAESEVSDTTLAAESLEAQKVKEQLEQERREREAKEGELRAEKIKFMYEDIYFKKGSYKLTSEARELLLRKAQWLQKNSDTKVIVEGHTAGTGSKEHNFALGDRRAGAVKSFLIGQGIASSRLVAVSYGGEQPIDTSGTEKARAKNRRVHFVFEE